MFPHSTVGPPVIIDLQPPGQIQVPPGGTAVLTVTASGGTLTYQWFFNDTALSDTLGEISGATESTLTVSNVQQDDVGDYHVRVTNIAGSVDSSSINITLMGELHPSFAVLHMLYMFVHTHCMKVSFVSQDSS